MSVILVFSKIRYESAILIRGLNNGHRYHYICPLSRRYFSVIGLASDADRRGACPIHVESYGACSERQLKLLFHFILAARKVPFRVEQQTTIWKHARMLHHHDTWLWLIQAFTAMIILIMGSIHMWTVLTDLPITAAKSAARIQGGFWMVFYLILLRMVELHVGIGFYRIGVKWGFIKRSNRKGLKRFENILTGIFILIGLITIIRFMTLAT